MIDLLVLIIICTAFAYVIQTRTCRYPSVRVGIKRDIQSKVIFWGILIAIILFAGLRTTYNDTSGYKRLFEVLVTKEIDFSKMEFGYIGFEIFQKLIKIYITENSQMLIFLSAIITSALNLFFIRRNSKFFCGSVFLFLIGGYIFSMAGIKQAIAVGIGIYAIEAYLNKKYIKAMVLLFLAMTFHPYIICLICIPLLKDRIWGGKTIAAIVVCVLSFLNIEVVFRLFSLIGKDYSGLTFDNYTINPFRVLVESVPIIISFIYRNELNKSNNKLLILGINMQIISFVFIAIGLFADPIHLGRMSTYFGCLSVIAIPEMLSICWGKRKDGGVLKLGYYLFFFVYFLMDMTKIGSISIFYDQFNHVALSSLF